ncbi:MAG: DUF4013 domain-containing protein [Chloroflexi bacterium]|nr:MAG: DUF4013 domain-containing protein [Chloroflexota bacterium]
MDIAKAFGYISEDENWYKKLGIGVGVFIVPILNFALAGYIFQLMRNVRNGEKRPLPEWSDLSRYLTDGLRMFVVMLIYSLPILIIYGIAMAIFFSQMLSSEFAASSTGGPPSIDQAPAFIAIWGIMAACVMPYSLLLQVMTPMFAMQLVREGTIKSCFEYKEMWQILKTNIWDYVIILGLTLGLYLVSSIVLIPAYLFFFIPCIGTIIGMALMGAVSILIIFVVGHLLGQFMAKHDAKQPPATEFGIV